MEFFDSAPPVHVDEAEYTRLLGFPRGHVLEGRSSELVAWTRTWYAAHGRPWIYARQSQTLAIQGSTVLVDGVPFRSDRLQQRLQQADADTVVLVAVSAGPEIERQAHQAWLQERPDEYFFLEMFGSAVVEHLTTMTGARLCGWADDEGRAVLPHYSPGYPDWDIADQPRLFSLLGRDALPGTLDVLESGMLKPKKSLLAVFGVTSHTERVARLSDLVPCEGCAFGPCQYRRAPYARAAQASSAVPPAAVPVTYGTSPKALQRWAADRLSLVMTADGGVDATFRYEGTTCSNMGRRLRFDYRVRLGPRADGYPIHAQSCVPAPGEDGFQAMCAYTREGESLIAAIAAEQPLGGQRLGDVLTWTRPLMGPGCYCELDSRQHKWGLVLETIHYALSNKDDVSR